MRFGLGKKIKPLMTPKYWPDANNGVRNCMLNRVQKVIAQAALSPC